MTREISSIPFLEQVRDAAAPSLVPLSAALPRPVADDEPDVRGWRVRTRADGEIGEVTDLIVEPGGMQVRYMDVRLERAHERSGRHVLVPIGVAQLDEACDDVHIHTGAASLLGAPEYTPGTMNRDYERAVLESYGWRGGSSGADRGHAFYRGPYFDERSFFAARRGRTERSYLSSISRRILHAWERCTGRSRLAERA